MQKLALLPRLLLLDLETSSPSTDMESIQAHNTPAAHCGKIKFISNPYVHHLTAAFPGMQPRQQNTHHDTHAINTIVTRCSWSGGLLTADAGSFTDGGHWSCGRWSPAWEKSPAAERRTLGCGTTPLQLVAVCSTTTSTPSVSFSSSPSSPESCSPCGRC